MCLFLSAEFLNGNLFSFVLFCCSFCCCGGLSANLPPSPHPFPTKKKRRVLERRKSETHFFSYGWILYNHGLFVFSSSSLPLLPLFFFPFLLPFSSPSLPFQRILPSSFPLLTFSLFSPFPLPPSPRIPLPKSPKYWLWRVWLCFSLRTQRNQKIQGYQSDQSPRGGG